jgi:hypothetical protein
MQKRGLNPVLPETKIPLGHRANWKERARLAVAKHGGRLTGGMRDREFAPLLLSPGPPGKPEEDEFVEVHIYGPITRRTLEKVTLPKVFAPKPIVESRSKTARKRVKLNAMAIQLQNAGVEVTYS